MLGSSCSRSPQTMSASGPKANIRRDTFELFRREARDNRVTFPENIDDKSGCFAKPGEMLAIPLDPAKSRLIPFVATESD
jgi:hypothetical protein